MQNRNYPLNEVERITSLRQLIDFRAEESGESPAFVYMKEGRKEEIQVTYSQLKEQVEQLGTFLFSRGYQRKKIAILGENSYEWILSFFAVSNGGNIAVPVDKELSMEAIGELLKGCGCSILIFSDAYCDIAERLGERAELDVINMKDFPDYLREGEESIKAGNLEYRKYQIDEEGMSVIFYTSGTSGKSKGVMLSQRNLAWDTYSSCRNVNLEGNTALLLPLHHTFGLLTSIFASMLYGYSVFINSSMRYLFEDIKLSKPRILFLVPLFVETLYKYIVRLEETAPKEKILEALGGNLRLIVSGGAPLNPKYIKAFAAFGITLLNGYGITECSPVVSVNRNEYNKEGSVGLILDECQVKIENPDKNGEGEICVKGPNVMLGYYRMEQETAEAIRDGWFHTGDIGHVDEENFLYITGRRKNMIILDNGENVSPEELESRLCNIPLVKEVVVYEKAKLITAEFWLDGEYAEAERISDAQKVLKEEVEKINRGLHSFKRIQKIKIRDSEFEKTTTKKIIRHKIV